MSLSRYGRRVVGQQTVCFVFARLTTFPIYKVGGQINSKGVPVQDKQEFWEWFDH